MNNYKDIITNAKDLQEEFGNKITLFESLQIATQIQLCEVLSSGLQTGYSNEPAFLEAIAIAIGYKKNSSDTIITALQERAD